MPLPTVQRVDPIVQTSWDSGMNTKLPLEELPPDAAFLIENFEFDDVGNLNTRLSPVLLVDTNANSAIVDIFTAHFSNGTSKIFFITAHSPGGSLYSMNLDGSSVTQISLNVTTPNEKITWLMFNDRVIFMDANTATWSIDSAGTLVNLTNINSAPVGATGVVWNNRLWLGGDPNNPNTLYGSAINDQTDWTVDDDSGAIQILCESDGDRINALSVFKGNLFVYKYSSIQVISAISAPATIPSNLRRDVYTDKLGCVQRHTVQNILDDQLFLSNAGVTSLSLAPLGEFIGAILSNDIDELGKIDLTSTTSLNSVTGSCDSLNVQKKQQYWISVPSGIGDGTDTVWVMDYSDIAKKDADGLPLVRWCKFTGNMFFRCASNFGRGLDTYILVNPSPGATDEVYTYDPINNNTTFTGTHSRRLLTRSFGDPDVRSIWHKFCTTLTKFTTSVDYSINYYFDNYLTAKAGGYSISLTGTPANNDRTIWKKFRKNDSGRKANLVLMEILANTTNQGFSIKSLRFRNTRLNEKRANTTWVSD